MTRATHLVTILAALFCACAAPSELVEASGSQVDNGKSDDAVATCEPYVVWAVHELGPQVEAGATTAEEIESALAEMRCDDQATAYGIWLGVFTDKVVVPFYERQGAAFEAYAHADSPVRGDYAAYLEGVGLTEEVRARADLLLIAMPSLAAAEDEDAAFSYQDWTNVYASAVEQVAQHIEQPGALGLELYDEPPMHINDAEREWLALVEAAAPRSDADGSYAAWFAEYDFYLDRALGRVSGFSHLGNERTGLTAGEMDFLAHLAEVQPAGAAGEDSAAFMTQYSATIAALPAGDSSLETLPGATQEVDSLESVAPALLGGARAYALWLSLGEDIADDHRDRYLAHEPCAELDEALRVLEEYETIGLIEDASALVERAGAPTSCGG